ncbi:MAG: lmo0937 family membrane protein [Thaumarchaeota archaeon]|nr:lmo0937 family membrane protein [Nitrososphaerota archaeon]
MKIDLFWTVAIILVVLWLFGFIGGVGGELIHLLLIVAVIVVAYRLFTGRNVVTGK